MARTLAAPFAASLLLAVALAAGGPAAGRLAFASSEACGEGAGLSGGGAEGSGGEGGRGEAAPAPAEASAWQVAYRLEILELTEARRRRLGLTELDLKLGPGTAARAGPAHRLIAEPGLLSLLAVVPPATLRLEALQAQERAQVRSHPWITGIVGQPARLRVVAEETLLVEGVDRPVTAATGLELTVTPLRVDAEGGRVLTRLQAGLPGAVELATEAWATAGAALPVAVIRLQTAGQARELLSRGSHETVRDLAVYLTAEPFRAPPEGPALVAGSLDGLGELLWPSAPQDGPAWPGDEWVEFGAAFFDPPVWEAAFSLWPREGLRVEGSVVSGPPRRYRLGVERRILPQDLRAVAAWKGFPDAAPVLSLGFSERVVLSPSFSLAAGWAPVTYDVGAGERPAQHWWVQVDWRRSRTLASLLLRWEGEPQLRGVVGYRGPGTVARTSPFLVVGYIGDLRGREAVWAGLRWEG